MVGWLWTPQAQKLLAEQQVRTESELELCLQKSSSGAANAARISRGQCLDMSEFHKVQVEVSVCGYSSASLDELDPLVIRVWNPCRTPMNQR